MPERKQPSEPTRRNLSNRLHFLIFGMVLVLAAYIRFQVAPFSSGPDVAQFWAFAEVFRQHGVDFYRYASAKTNFFPFQYWAYVYPPIWLLILGVALLAAPASLATSTMVSVSWRLAEKTPIILADLAIGVLLYWAVPGSKSRKLLFACLWLFNPVSWYNSAVFGQFDAVAAAFLLASIISLERGKDRVAFLLAGLAGMTKQNALIPVAVIIVALARQMPWRRLLSDCGILAGVVVVISIPFLITGNFGAYVTAVLFPAQQPAYQLPLEYAFNGVAALFTYLHNIFGWDTLPFFSYFVPVMASALVASMVLVYLRKISALRGALIGVLLFIALFYRINYQYLVIFIPIALFIASRTPYRSEKAMALILALFPAIWVWLFDVSFWFRYLDPKNPWVTPIFAKIGLTHLGMPDYTYVAFAMALTGICLTYIIMALVRNL